MLDNPRGENRRRLPIRSPGVLGYCQGSFQCCHWYCQSFFKVGIDIFNDIFKVVIGIFEVVNCSLFTNLTTFPTKVLGIERKVIGQHHASAVLYEHRFIQNKQQFQYWPWLLIIITLKFFKGLEVRIIYNSVRQFRTYKLTPTNWLLMITTGSSSSGHHFYHYVRLVMKFMTCTISKHGASFVFITMACSVNLFKSKTVIEVVF